MPSPCGDKWCTYKETFAQNGESEGYSWLCQSSDQTTGDEIEDDDVDTVDNINNGSGMQTLGQGAAIVCMKQKKCNCLQRGPNVPSFKCKVDTTVVAVPLETFNDAKDGGPMGVMCGAPGP